MITMIITVRYRQHTLPRILEYYKNFSGRVIVADASPEKYAFVDKWPYVEYHFTPNTPWMEMMVDVLKTVDTKYVVKMCDDDFLPLSSIQPQIDFLESNPDYVTVMGQEVALYDSDFRYETLEYLLESKHLALRSDDKKARVAHEWTYFTTRIHNIARTDAQLKVYSAMVEYPDLYAVRFFDKIWGFMMAAMGNVGVIPVFSIVRSQESLVGNVSLAKRPEIIKLTNDENKSSLRFKDDFLNRDLTFFEEFAGVDRKFIEDLHENLCTEKYKLIEYDKMLSQNNLDCEEVEVDSRNNIRVVNAVQIGNYPLIPRYGPAASNDWFPKFTRHNGLREDIYPCFKQESLDDLNEIYQMIIKYPLGEMT